MAINHGSLSANLTPRGVVGGRVQNSVLAYENDYENLINKPSINDTELNGDLSLEDLGIVNNVQPDWEQTDAEADDYINNKPDIPENLSDLNDDADHRTVSDTEKTTWNNKSDFSGSYNDLTDKPVIPDAQIQSDWNQNDNTKADYIKNKPTIPAEQVNSDWDAESGKAQILNKPSIPTALADLTDDSTHRTVTDTEKTAWNSGEANVQSNWNETDTTSDAYIQNKPSIPSVTANPGSTTATLSSIGIDGTNYAISGGSGGGAVDSVNGQTGIVVLDAEDVGALPDDTPLFSGDYEDLTNKPTIPDDLADLNDDSTHRLVTDTEKTTWNGKSDFSGSYNDLSNKPTLGTASALDVPVSGNASTSQVVKGDDSRLTDARTPVSHTHTTSDITDFPTMSDYIQKSNTSGLVKNDGTIDTNSYATTSQIPDISGKADKVSGATNGNLAGLDASGNLTDSGRKSGDYSRDYTIAYSETTTIATRAYNVGEYIYIENVENLFRVKTSIAIGDNLIEPTNIVSVTVGHELTSIMVNKADKDTATTSSAGLMSASDKSKLDGLPNIRCKIVDLDSDTIGTNFSPTSTNVGSVSTLFGQEVTQENLLSIQFFDAGLTPAACLIPGCFGGYLYVAATQITTLITSTVRCLITYVI